MDIELARLIRDRERGRDQKQRVGAFARQSGTRKHREIHLQANPQQVANAMQLLQGLPDLEVAPGLLPHCISVWYDISIHCQQSLELFLEQHDYCLLQTLYCRALRGWIYYSEQTQLRNLRQPERLLKKYNETYSHAWEHHPHGDFDETPPDLRQDR